MTTGFFPTLTDMVAIVRNIIHGYDMGPIRALAQEPVQNSKDAHRGPGNVHVEYRMQGRTAPNGEQSRLLTITDWNTTGLQGPIRNWTDAQSLEGALQEGENWAAFEGMGYTKKSGDDSLGSRGQGKAAYLYHSDLNMMLYDTLLPDGDYRLGVRRALPHDSVHQPPFRGAEARNIVSTHYALPEDGRIIPLELEPLTRVGTRVIVPHLSHEAVEAFNTGELYQWLQRCWWRAVQIGLTVHLVDEQGAVQTVAVPSWWENEPWNQCISNMRMYENLDVGTGLRIKRLVFLYDESITEPDILGVSPQFMGLQLLRGQQWIETLSQELADYIPRDKRMGFRGFVEFDRAVERDLRSEENPQHEKFHRRTLVVRRLVDAIHEKVREFSGEMGWFMREAYRPAPSTEQRTAYDFLHFLSPSRRADAVAATGPQHATQLSMDFIDHWECSLLLDLPNPRTTQVNWGQHIGNVRADIRVESLDPLKSVTAVLDLLHLDSGASFPSVASQDIEIHDGTAVVFFGDVQIISGTPSPGKWQCAQPGKWKITLRVLEREAEVDRAARYLYVQEEPPTSVTKPYTLSISVENHTTPGRRINSEDTIGVQISVTNRTPDPLTLELTASVGDLLLADATPVFTPGTPAGESPVRIPGVLTTIKVNPSISPSPPTQPLAIPEGIHTLSADLYTDDHVVAHASRKLDIDVDPAQDQNWPPFRIEQITGEEPFPRWQFDMRGDDDWVLQYPPTNLLYRALQSVNASDGNGLTGGSAFVVDICAEGIIEWALSSLDDSTDDSRLIQLTSGAPPSVDLAAWEAFCEKIDHLVGLRGEPDRLTEYGRLFRECAARCLQLYEERV